MTAYSETMTGGFAVGGTAPTTKTTYHIVLSGGVSVGSDSPVSNATENGASVLVSGRSEAFTTK